MAGQGISGGLAPVGAVVAEFVAGAGGFAAGLAYRIQEAGYRLQISRMFAALVLLCAAGIAIHAALAGLERWLMRRRDGR
jgi:NitT/TauT family transport system permease protein